LAGQASQPGELGANFASVEGSTADSKPPAPTPASLGFTALFSGTLMAMPKESVTRILSAIDAGNPDAASELLPLVYEQLRKAAQVQMAAERSDHTLSATALVHEAYLKLVGPRDVPWAGRGHFYAAAAQAMRQILLDHAKGRARLKRGGPRAGHAGGYDFEDFPGLAAREPDEILSFDAALRRLEAESPQVGEAVRLRFFAGLTVDQTAEAMGVSDRTVDRLWLYARAWLHRAMTAAKE
jgi:RNA polymerase sigma factor (TIGR02999 family)